MRKSTANRAARLLLTVLILHLGGTCTAAAAGFTGAWVLDEQASDDTDRQVEKAIKAAGGRIGRTEKKGKGRYRGGPADHELYDHISYDEAMTIRIAEPEIRIDYTEGLTRVFYTDNRSRSVSASGNPEGVSPDYSFAGWEDGRLRVESRPRDGGWIVEMYTLLEGGQQLRVEMQLKPSSFMVPIEIIRVFNRRQEPQQ